MIIGQGGREHALAWKIKQSKSVEKIFVIPGNDGMRDVASIIKKNPLDYKGIVDFAVKEKIDLTIIGNEQPLCDGLVDMMEEKNLMVFGPNKKAARIEGSKFFAKQIMDKYNIPTAQYALCDNESQAVKYLSECDYPVVLKADGLAAGKGVYIVKDYNEAIANIKILFSNHSQILIEEYLEGFEFSLIGLANGEIFSAFEIAQDYKRIYDDNMGPNTGGMGSYSPVNEINNQIIQDSLETIIKPILLGMVKENCPFKGFLYAGLMLTKKGVKVIEFNARLGDPETEVILPRMESDLVDCIFKIMKNEEFKINFNKKSCVGVVVASKGYPNEYEVGRIIDVLNQEVLVFHMGTKLKENQYISNGGRVLIAVCLADSIMAAREKTYDSIKEINRDDFYYRKDIALKN